MQEAKNQIMLAYMAYPSVDDSSATPNVSVKDDSSSNVLKYVGIGLIVFVIGAFLVITMRKREV